MNVDGSRWVQDAVPLEQFRQQDSGAVASVASRYQRIIPTLLRLQRLSPCLEAVLQRLANIIAELRFPISSFAGPPPLFFWLAHLINTSSTMSLVNLESFILLPPASTSSSSSPFAYSDLTSLSKATRVLKT